VTSKGEIKLEQNGSNASIQYEADQTLVIQSSVTNKPIYKISITQNGDFKFYNGTTLLASLNSGGMTLTASMSAPSIKTSNTVVSSNNIYNNGTNSDNGTIDINVLGYNGGNTYYRNTNIGDGRGNTIFSIHGKTKACIVNGQFAVHSSDTMLSLVHSSLQKANAALMSYFTWRDKDNALMARVGYTDSTTFDWCVDLSVGNIALKNDVYISGNLYVGGKNIMDYFVSKTSINQSLADKANVSDVYTKTVADDRFASKTETLNQFVERMGGAGSLRTAIGALSSLGDAALKTQKLNDIVNAGLPPTNDSTYATKLAERKEELCNNIGAAYGLGVWTTVKTQIQKYPVPIAWGDVIGKDGSTTITAKTWDGRSNVFSITRQDRGKYLITCSDAAIIKDPNFVMLTGSGRNLDVKGQSIIFAAVQSFGSGKMIIETADDASNNDGAFNFVIYGVNWQYP
jgi:hypothetical protein